MKNVVAIAAHVVHVNVVENKTMKLTKESLKRIIKEELQAVLNEEALSDQAVLNEETASDQVVLEFLTALRKASYMWSRDRAQYGGFRVNGVSYSRNLANKTKAYKATDDTRIQSQDPSQLLREVTTVIEIPGLQTYRGSVLGTEGKYNIQIMLVARDESKMRNRAFDNMGNQSMLGPIMSDLQDFPQDGPEFAKVVAEKEKQFSNQLISEQFMQNVLEKSGPKGDRVRDALLEAIIDLASKVYGMNFKVREN